MKIVISIGGSILAPEKVEADFIRNVASLFKRLSGGYKLYLVVGGGALARKYIKIARELGAAEKSLDEIGIASTRLNARLLITALDEFAYPEVLETFDDVVEHAQQYPLIVMGGTEPGHTTDAVAVTLAEKINADIFINATSVDGVYTADPKLEPDAKKIDKLSPDRLIELTNQDDYKAGPHIVIDGLAAQIIKRSAITTYVVDGRDMTALENAIIGKPFNGSTIMIEE